MNQGATSHLFRRPPARRILLVTSMMFTAAMFASCERDAESGKEGGEEGHAVSVTEGDSLQCGRNEDVFVNGTAFARDLHVRIRNGCSGRDTLGTDSMRVWVRSAGGQVVNGQSYRIPAGGTHRGTVTLNSGASLRVECPPPLIEDQRGWCTWEYKYVLR